MKKIIITLTACLAGISGLQAQQLLTSSNFDLQGTLFNPAMAGIHANPGQKGAIGVSYRHQWAGISGSPKTMLAFGSFALDKHKIGIAGGVSSDETGPIKRNAVTLNLAKHITLDKDQVLSLGIESRYQQYRIDYSKISEALANDPILNASGNSGKFDMGFGISFRAKNWLAGVSVSQLIQSKLDIYTGNLSRSAEGRLYRHYYAHALYRWDVDGHTVLYPNVLFTYLPNAPLEVNGSVRVEHEGKIWWGVGYRSNQSWMLSLGLNIRKKISIGYGYDRYIMPVSGFDNGNGAHEILLRYNMFR